MRSLHNTELQIVSGGIPYTLMIGGALVTLGLIAFGIYSYQQSIPSSNASVDQTNNNLIDNGFAYGESYTFSF